MALCMENASGRFVIAAILFSTVGQAVGGPLGAAVGAAVGSTVDRSLLGRGAEASGALQLQRSSYGEPIPRLYGRSRQSGSLLWALPLGKGGVGKGSGRPSYVSSFAIGLSARPILDIGRIWADGREIRNSNGDFAATTDFRVYRGDGNDSVDPAIAAAEGISNAPAYAGLAYVVFEDFSLAEFGNRIPNLSFEVTADHNFTGPAEWLADIASVSGVEFTGSNPANLAIGYSASDDFWSGDAQSLSKIADLPERYSGGRLSFSNAGRIHSIALDDICVGSDIEVGAAQRRSVALGDRPGGVIVGYYDPDRDFQAGSQRAVGSKFGRMQLARASLTTTASLARTLAHRLLRQEEAAVSTLDVTLSWRWYAIAVGDSLEIAGQAERWRVVRTEVRGMLLHVSCVLEPSVGAQIDRQSSPGRVLPAPLLVAAPTAIAAFELPMAVGGKGGEGFWVSASGTEGWRGAEIVWAAEGGDWTSLGAVSEPLARGVLVSPLGAGTSQLWDEHSILEVELDRDDMWLESRSSAAVLSGSNLLRVGAELLQYRSVEPFGRRRFRLKGLLRGRWGTHYASSVHPTGELIERMDPAKLQFQQLGSDRIGERIMLRALGRGEPAGGIVREFVVAGAGSAPMAPCHIRASRQVNGDLLFVWKARDRRMFEWSAEEVSLPYSFLCKVFVSSEQGGLRIEKRVTSQEWLYSASEQARDFGGPLVSFSLAIAAEGSGPELIRSTDWVTSALLFP